MVKKVEIEIAAKSTAGPVIKDVANDMASIAPAAGKAQGAAVGALDSMHKRGVKASEAAKSISDQLALVQRAYVALQATQGMQAIASDLAQTADAYNNLAARIQLVTGEGAAFTTSFEAVSAIAQRTSSNLESTGNLFAKLGEAGKSAGLDTQAAIAQSLALTETVNQAVQLSGASAAASDAAITQLIQGLQGGALRGDEFNSVMEQAPRLAKALADGLGVTTGELRKMAEAGQLSSDVVIKALKGQADTVASEFSKLPPTVGRALENLSTSWTLYVGQTDKATGASQAAATVISGLANNLNTVAGYLIDAGQAAGAFAALRLAQHFLSVASGATAAAGAVAGATGAMGASTVAAGLATRAVGLLSVALRAIPMFGLVALVANLKDVGTWLGETAAKAMGYRIRTEEAAVADQAAAIAAAKHAAELRIKNAALDDAIKRQTGYSDLIQKHVDRLTLSAQALSAEAQARKTLASALGDETEIRNANAAAASLQNQADQKNLQAAQLELNFLRETIIEKTALLALGGKISEASQKELSDMSVLLGKRQEAVDKMQAQATASELLAAKTAIEVETSKDNSARLDELKDAYAAVTQEVDALRRKKEAGEPVDDALNKKLIEQAKALALVRDAVNDTEKAFHDLGIKTPDELDKIAKANSAAWERVKADSRVSVADMQKAFQTYAESAIAANKGVATEAIKAEAAMRGLEVVTDSTGKTIVRAMGTGKDATDKYTGSVNTATSALERQNTELEKTIAAQEKANDLAQRAIDLENKRLNRDKEGFSLNTAGDRVSMQGDNQRSVYENAKSQGLSDAQALQIAEKFIQNGQKIAPDGFNARAGENWGTALQKAIDALVLQNAKTAASTGTSTPPSPASQIKTYTVNLNVNGQNTPVNVASEGDAQALISALQRAKTTA